MLLGYSQTLPILIGLGRVGRIPAQPYQPLQHMSVNFKRIYSPNIHFPIIQKKKNSVNYIRTYSIDYNRKKCIILWETTIVVCLNFRVGVSDTFMSVNFILSLFWPLLGSTQQGPFHYFSKVCHFVLRLIFVWLHFH